ncbi:MAG TPA: hypothetical protein VIQ31_35160, partial [Phormidium sp.]
MTNIFGLQQRFAKISKFNTMNDHDNLDPLDVFAQDISDDEKAGVCLDIDEEDFIKINNNNVYLQSLSSSNELKIRHPEIVTAAYRANGDLGLFKLFITNSMLQLIRDWTNSKLELSGKSKTSIAELTRYIGLELGMGCLQMNAISDYWSDKPFTGSALHKETMSRDRFQCLRANIQLHASDVVTKQNNDHTKDPLWHIRQFLQNFTQNSVNVAVPTGTSALDEITVRCKARSKAVSYIPLKPIKFGIRFYATVGTKNAYLYNIWDTGRGNNTGVSPAHAYTQTNYKARALLSNSLNKSTILDSTSPSGLWTIMMAEQCVMDTDGNKRVFFTDNFYTRHVIAKELDRITDGKAKLIGTVRFNNIEKLSKAHVMKATKLLEDKPRGHWMLVQVIEAEAKPDGSEKTKGRPKKAHALTDKDKNASPSNQSTISKPRGRPKKTDNTKSDKANPVTPNNSTADTPGDKDIETENETEVSTATTGIVAKNSGYIVFKDKKIVLFYSNDLASTPCEPVLDGNDPRAIDAVHGLAEIKRWLGMECMTRSSLHVPAVVVAYNLYMNAVDRFDQARGTNACQRKEVRLNMSVFTFLIDAAVSNAYALSKVENKDKRSLSSFKRDLAVQMCRTIEHSARDRQGDASKYPKYIHDKNKAQSSTKSTKAAISKVTTRSSTDQMDANAAAQGNAAMIDLNNKMDEAIDQSEDEEDDACIENAIGSIDSWHCLVTNTNKAPTTCFV